MNNENKSPVPEGNPYQVSTAPRIQSQPLLPITIILSIIVLGLATAIWLLIDRQGIATDDDPTPSTSQKLRRIDTAIHDVNIRLRTRADLDRLPDYTPQGFIGFLYNELPDTQIEKIQDAQGAPGEIGSTDEALFVWEFHITRISQVNVKGEVDWVTDSNVSLQGGSAGYTPDTWVLTPTGRWEFTNSMISLCMSDSGGSVYIEFASECLADNEKPGYHVPNPNGSITTIND